MNKNYVFTSFFILTLILISILFFKVISPFILDIFLALLLTHFFLPIRKKFSIKFSSRISSVATIAVIIFSVVIPIITIGWMVSIEIAEIYKASIENWPDLQQKILDNPYIKDVSTIPFIGSEISNQSISDFIKEIGQVLTDFAKISFLFLKSFLVNLTSTTIHFLFTLLLTFYLLADYDKAKKFLNNIIPMDKDDAEEIYGELKKTSDGTVKGIFLIGIIEGTFGALLLTSVGISSGFVWGVIMFVLSMLPLIGITVVLIPFAIVLFFIGHIYSALLILIIGISGVTFTQNILKPKLVGDASGLHQGIVLISSLGGISLFGIAGFIIGPMIATLFFVIWKQFALKYED